METDTKFPNELISETQSETSNTVALNTEIFRSDGKSCVFLEVGTGSDKANWLGS